ncbi:MAG: oxidoreductase [Bacillota bacterium]|jgi:predicted dehydrogenase|nr:oxidoreductase [Bacillota bacterium]
MGRIMNVIIIGLGSMGKRRIRLLKQYDPNLNIIGVDGRLDRLQEVGELFHIPVYKDLNDAIRKEKPCIAFICASPIGHYDITVQCIKQGIHIFSELNLINENHKQIIDLAGKHRIQLFLSSTLLYRKEIQYLVAKLNGIEQKVHYRYHVGQYLPDWHPWENVNEFFVSDKKTNGCRELLAIELPWILKAFGDLKTVTVIKDTLTSLNLTYPDSYIIVMEHDTGHKGVLNVDVASRKATRNLEIYSEHLHLFWDGTPNGLKTFDFENKELVSLLLYENVQQDSNYADNIIENAYLEEIRSFFREMGGATEALYSYEEDIHILELINRIEA